jgi:hypothetical protein
MGFFASVQNAATKVKLQGEIALVDREIKARQQQFGIDLYNVVSLNEKSKVGTFKTPSLFHAAASEIKLPFDECHAEIKVFQNELDAKTQEYDKIELSRERYVRPTQGNNEAFTTRTGNRVSDYARESKLVVQMTLLGRQIKQRKEQFGVDVCALSVASKKDARGKTGTFGGKATGVKKGLAGQLSKLSGDESKIQEVIDIAKKDVDMLEKKKASKEREIALLDAEN